MEDMEMKARNCEMNGCEHVAQNRLTARFRKDYGLVAIVYLCEIHSPNFEKAFANDPTAIVSRTYAGIEGFNA